MIANLRDATTKEVAMRRGLIMGAEGAGEVGGKGTTESRAAAELDSQGMFVLRWERHCRNE